MSRSTKEILGEERYFEICKKNGLTDESVKIVGTIFEKWDKAVGNPNLKMKIFLSEVKASTQRDEIITTVLEISKGIAALNISPT